MQVLKFGGSSVASSTNMSRVLDIVENAAAQDRVILVSSAISGCTDKLIAAGKVSGSERAELIKPLRAQHHDIINRLFTGNERDEVIETIDSLFRELRDAPGDECETFGELFSTKILAAKLACEGRLAVWLDSRDLVVKDCNEASYAKINAALEAYPGARIFVVPGFIARTAEGKITTLGRGGSDLSASIYAAATQAASLQIWTDVPGIMTTNPRVVPSARTIGRISYAAAFTMAEHGAKVLYAPTVIPAREKGIAINIRNTFDPANPGTIIEELEPGSVCEWVGLSSAQTAEGSVRLYLTAEGPVDAPLSLRRINDALTGVGVAQLGSGSEQSLVWTDVRPGVEKQACVALHREFFEEEALKTFDVYVAGYGAVGHALEKLIKSGLSERNGRRVRLAGISSDHAFAEKVLAEAPRHAVFVDCTNSEDIWKFYVPMLEKGINIVSSNRYALAVPYVDFAAMKHAALSSGSFFRYGTTIGAALPILEAIAGEQEIESVDAVVSCTMNHIITGYDGANTESFATLLMHAQDAGLTEIDPRIDLSGHDALRKLLILAREAGVRLEESDVEITPMVGEEYFDCPLDEFYRRLQAAEPEFIRREAELDEMDKRQRFVASLRKTASGWKAEIKMQLYGISSPFYWISGTQNIIEIKSRGAAPLLIKGAGEGAQQAASSILKDIIR